MRVLRFFVRFIFLIGCGLAWSQSPQEFEEGVTTVLAQREALAVSGGLKAAQLSEDILVAMRESEKLRQEAQYELALERLQVLQKHGPLIDIPSLSVQAMAAWLCGRLTQFDLQKAHGQRAGIHARVLFGRIGSGASANDPLRVVLQSEITDWLRVRTSTIVDISSRSEGMRELTIFSYRRTGSEEAPRQLFVEVDPRVRVQSMGQVELFKPLPLAGISPRMVEWVRVATERRERFLNDKSFSRIEFWDAVESAMKKSLELQRGGKWTEAMAALRDIERLRPIEETPTPRLLMMYSFLLGRTGNSDKQADARALLFGVQQTIAHSGDGKTPETAIHVLNVDEEYQWLADKKLKRTKQTMHRAGGEIYDLLEVTDAQGAKTEVYFKITRFFPEGF